MVGVEGFELSTSCSQSKRATGLRHTPKLVILPNRVGNGQSSDHWPCQKTKRSGASVEASVGCIGVKHSGRNKEP